MVNKSKGKVKWFDAKKGYGFIIGESGKEVFVHFSDIVSKGYKNLIEADNVSFDIQSSPKGIKAVNVEIITR